MPSYGPKLLSDKPPEFGSVTIGQGVAHASRHHLTELNCEKIEFDAALLVAQPQSGTLSLPARECVATNPQIERLLGLVAFREMAPCRKEEALELVAKKQSYLPSRMSL